MGLVAIIQLKREEHLDTVSALLIELGVFEVSIVESEGVEQYAQRMPVLNSMGSIFGGWMEHHRTIICRVPSEEKLEKLVEYAARDGIEFNSPDVGALFAMPCSYYIGEP